MLPLSPYTSCYRSQSLYGAGFFFLSSVFASLRLAAAARFSLLQAIERLAELFQVRVVLLVRGIAAQTKLKARILVLFGSLIHATPGDGCNSASEKMSESGSGSMAKMDTVSELLAAFLPSVVATETEENA